MYKNSKELQVWVLTLSGISCTINPPFFRSYYKLLSHQNHIYFAVKSMFKTHKEFAFRPLVSL